jgi:hypothetical protein
MNSSSNEFSQLLTKIDCSLGVSRYIVSGGPHGKESSIVPYCFNVFTDPLPRNRRTIVARVGFRGNVFTEPLPSNGYIHNNIA